MVSGILTQPSSRKQFASRRKRSLEKVGRQLSAYTSILQIRYVVYTFQSFFRLRTQAKKLLALGLDVVFLLDNRLQVTREGGDIRLLLRQSPKYYNNFFLLIRWKHFKNFCFVLMINLYVLKYLIRWISKKVSCQSWEFLKEYLKGLGNIRYVDVYCTSPILRNKIMG